MIALGSGSRSLGCVRYAACASLLAALAAPVSAAAFQELVVVRKSGQSYSHVSHNKSATQAAAACADPGVAFAFTVEPSDGVTSIEVERNANTVLNIPLTVTLGCSSVDGTALLAFTAVGGTAVSGTDFVSTPGSALLNLTSHDDGSGAPSSASASVNISILGTPQSSARTLSVVRTEGSFQGVLADGQPLVGVIPGSNSPIVSVTILGSVNIGDATGGIPGVDPAAGEVGTATANFCGQGGGGTGSTACQATQVAAELVADPDTPSSVREAATEVLENNLLAIAPDETTAIAFVAPILATGQFDNLASRVAELRTADMGGTISTGGLTLLSNGMPISLASLAVLNQTDDPQSERNEERRTLLGGTRLGMWLNGNLGSSESDRRESNSGFESDTWNITGGVDYRFTDQFFAGVALGFSSLDADYSNEQGSLDADSRSVHLYSGYAIPNGLSFDGSVSYLRSDYTQKRVIEIMQLDGSGTGMQSLGRDIATGKPSVDQYGFSFGVTYTIMRGTWTIAPQAQFSLVRTRYEAFQETGPSDFNLRYAERSNNNRSLSAGAYVDRTFATSVGAFRPYLRAYYFADSGASNDLITSFVQANDDGSNESLTLSMIEPDNRYGTAEMGLGFSRPIGTRTVDFNVGYLQTFSFQDLNRWALRFDVRIPL